MRPSDLIDLALLGVLSEAPGAAARVVPVVKRLGSRGFVPTTDVVETRLAHLVERGHVEVLAGGLLTLGPGGPSRILELLLAGGPSPAEALGAACHRLRICLLELVPAGIRAEVVADMIQSHRRELEQSRSALARCPSRCRFVERCLAREVDRWAAELDWLERLAGEQGVTGLDPHA